MIFFFPDPEPPSFSISSNVFLNVCFYASIHITQLCFFSIFWFYVVTLKLINYYFTYFNIFKSNQTGFFIRICVFLILISNRFPEKKLHMMVSFWYQIVSSFFCCHKFNVLMISHIFYSFSKNWIIHQLKKKMIFKIIFFLDLCSCHYIVLTKLFN